MSPGRRLRHQALEPVSGIPPAEAEITDQQRLAVVLEGAALLAHLEHAGCVLQDGWSAARLDPRGRLVAVAIRRGRGSPMAQAQLVALVEILFGGAEIAGRGSARRAARRLTERWRQTLTPLAADRLVTHVFDAAPFLWQPAFGIARQALVAEHRNGSRRWLWIVGPGASRRRFLTRAMDYASLAELAASSEAQALWSGWRAADDPFALRAAGRLRRATAFWERSPPAGARETLAHADTLFALGRYERALAALRGARSIPARLLRARCQAELGELRAARNTVHRLVSARLSGPATVEAAEIAVRLLANQGQADAIGDWVARALAAGLGRWRQRARIVAALAAWDLRDAAAMARHLEAARAARDDPEIAWRWHHGQGLYCQLLRDGMGIVSHLRTVLRRERRRLPRGLAGRLWSDVALGRVLIDDLPGAERACRHALRLLQECDGPSSTTLALHNLAEVRLRRGNLEGVVPILELSTRENRRAGNVRGLLGDLELWLRLELAQGRTAAALVRCAEARELMAGQSPAIDNGLWAVLEARALGWQGKAEAADAALGSTVPDALAELEPEERPAVLALAGRRRDAADLARGGVWAALWRALAEGAAPPSQTWETLAELEPYRGARLIFDCELVAPGVAPPQKVRWAAEILRRCAAEPLAERLEGRSLSAWRAVERHLARGPETTGETAWKILLERAGYDGVRLIREGPSRARELIVGAGGAEKLAAPIAGGRLVLSAPSIDSRLRALFFLVRREITLADPESAPRASSDEMIGESAALRDALERLTRLAGVDLPILILGESGTGKELAARHAHRSSLRASGPFLAVNCAAMSETLIMSDLFGHVRGAFTGADRDRPGVFETARGGTVFLDEIGDLPTPVQGMLLRVIQESEIRRVGESHPRRIDVRIVAATHRDLEAMVRDQTFRQDLYFRLKVATVFLPPLRERAGDVLLLAKHFLDGAQQSGSRRSRLTRAACRRLESHTWPGNVRELRNILEVAAALAGGGEIVPEHLDLPGSTPLAEGTGSYHARLDAFRKQMIERALDVSGGNRARAARGLGISRQALSYLVRRLGLT